MHYLTLFVNYSNYCVYVTQIKEQLFNGIFMPSNMFDFNEFVCATNGGLFSNESC